VLATQAQRSHHLRNQKTKIDHADGLFGGGGRFRAKIGRLLLWKWMRGRCIRFFLKECYAFLGYSLRQDAKWGDVAADSRMLCKNHRFHLLVNNYIAFW
jgi:hypothetical protein